MAGGNRDFWHAIVVRVPSPRPVCFFAISFSPGTRPISDAVEEVFREIATERNLDLKPIRLDDVPQGPAFPQAIINSIRSARMVVADCSPQEPCGHARPNVMFELGQAVALGKPTLILTSDLPSLPSDLQGTDVVLYNREEVGTEAFRKKIHVHLRATLERMGTNQLTDPFYDAISEIRSDRPLIPCPPWLDSIVLILKYAKEAHHEFQSFDSTCVDQVRRVIERIMRSRAVRRETTMDLEGHWQQTMRYYTNQLALNVLRKNAELSGEVERRFNELSASAPQRMQAYLANSRACFDCLREKIDGYPAWMERAQSQAKDLWNLVKDLNATLQFGRDIVGLSEGTKSVVVDADNLILNLIDLVVERQA